MSKLVDRSSTLARMRDALRLEPSKTVVLTIDCQKGNLDPELASLPVPADQCSRVIAGTNRLVQLARRCGVDVIHMTTAFEASLLGTHPFEKAMLELKESFSPGRKSDFKRHKSPGSKEAEFVDGLDVQPADLVIDGKRTFDSFEGTPLDRLLRSMAKDTLLIAGCNTNTCVLSTTFGAYNRGYRAVVISDCVASAYGDDLHEFALSNIERRLGWVLNLEELETKVAAV